MNIKNIFVFFLFAAFVLPGAVFAQDVGNYPKDHPCANDNECDQALACISGKCEPDAQGSDANAGNNFGGTPSTPPTTPAGTPPAGTPATPGATTPGSSGDFTDTNFVSLTKIPAFTATGNSGDLTTFLNNIYKICIGLAAILAVLQIMRAGVLYMLEGGFLEKKEARGLIASAIGGLLLVLSPVIVFSIINPSILSLKLNNLSGLTPATTAPATPGTSMDTTSQQICSGYSTFQVATLPAGKFCSDVMGPGWVLLNAACTGPTVPTVGPGQSLCGYNTSYTPPAPGKFDGPYSFSITYQSTDDLTGKACQGDLDQGGFTDLPTCQSAFDGRIAAIKNTYAIGRSCTDSGIHTPTPSSDYSKIQNLPQCPQ